jgi:hypothetical protein
MYLQKKLRIHNLADFPLRESTSYYTPDRINLARTKTSKSVRFSSLPNMGRNFSILAEVEFVRYENDLPRWLPEQVA